MRSTVQCTKKIIAFLTSSNTDSWLSVSTLSRWTKEIAQISVQENLLQFSNQFGSYSIIADESTRGKKKIFLVCASYSDEKQQQPMLTILSVKDLDHCSASTVSSSVGEAIIKYSLNLAQYEVFVEELLIAHEFLLTEEFYDLTSKLENGLIKALELFKK
ncbi:2491_t:CDS:2 [Dentiscutata erythropus]|uniref:2491_t:CDS:1 n=1 Tax=Dentiscutata erythropus TaxID=1348616 RepID=A0A9N8ZFS0_9GLOM|nr:2491_t:CDS:2 [Dentiscutata erythropus]